MELIIIGGSPCSGKSTVAKRYAETYGYQHIQADSYLSKHIKQSKVEDVVINKWKKNPWHVLLTREPKLQFKEMVQFYEEEWKYLVDDIMADIQSEKVILEGCAFLPHSTQNTFERATIIYMIPTITFQLEKYSQRTWISNIVEEANDPVKTFSNWMERDHLFANFIHEQANLLQIPLIINDGTNSESQLFEHVCKVIKK